MFPFVKTTVSALFISALLTSAPVFADIVISGTRIIYDANKKDVSVRLENKGNRPLLVQNWLDTGDDNADPSQIKVPFASTPPVSRIEPKRGQTIKIAYTSATPLSSDREVCSGLTCWKSPQKSATPPLTTTCCNWHSAHASNFFIARAACKVNPLKLQQKLNGR